MVLLLAGVAVVFWPWSFEHHAAKNLLVQGVGFITGGAWAVKYLLRGEWPVRSGNGRFLCLLGLFAVSGMVSCCSCRRSPAPRKKTSCSGYLTYCLRPWR